MNFKELLESKGIKQKWLAEQLGVKKLQVHRWVHGKSYPNEIYMEKILKMFRKSSSIHLFGKKKERKDKGVIRGKRS